MSRIPKALLCPRKKVFRAALPNTDWIGKWIDFYSSSPHSPLSANWNYALPHCVSHGGSTALCYPHSYCILVMIKMREGIQVRGLHLVHEFSLLWLFKWSMGYKWDINGWNGWIDNQQWTFLLSTWYVSRFQVVFPRRKLFFDGLAFLGIFSWGCFRAKHWHCFWGQENSMRVASTWENPMNNPFFFEKQKSIVFFDILEQKRLRRPFFDPESHRANCINNNVGISRRKIEHIQGCGALAMQHKPLWTTTKAIGFAWNPLSYYWCMFTISEFGICQLVCRGIIQWTCGFAVGPPAVFFASFSGNQVTRIDTVVQMDMLKYELSSKWSINEVWLSGPESNALEKCVGHGTFHRRGGIQHFGGRLAFKVLSANNPLAWPSCIWEDKIRCVDWLLLGWIVCILDCGTWKVSATPELGCRFYYHEPHLILIACYDQWKMKQD